MCGTSDCAAHRIVHCGVVNAVRGPCGSCVAGGGGCGADRVFIQMCIRDSYRNNVGIAFQEFPLYSLPLRDNLSVYEPANDKEMNIIFKSLSLDKVLEKNNATFDTDLTRNFDENGIMLSGGEKQKLAVARLMTKKFGLLIFDEPTAALDPIAEAELNRMILDKANTSTTILISHRLSNVVNADYIYVDVYKRQP